MPDVTEFREARLLQFPVHIELVFLGLGVAVQQLVHFGVREPEERHIEVSALQIGNLDRQHFLVPSRVHREAVVREDIRFLLRLGQVLREYTRNLGDALLFCRHDPAMTRYDGIFFVYNYGRHEPKLP